jgi:MFS family permease
LAQRFFLLAAVFVGGMASLGIQLSASRLLAPFFGTSQLIWANLIGLTLIYLTIGYRVGGKYADRYPDERRLAMILLAAGLVTACIPLVAGPILHVAALVTGGGPTGVFFGSFIGVLLLFSAPVILLGMVSPYAIRLAVRDIQSAGSTAGSLYALSTFGSIAGTFLPVLLLIPMLGTSRTFYVFALMLVLTGAAGMRRRTALVAVPVVLLLALLQLGMLGGQRF